MNQMVILQTVWNNQSKKVELFEENLNQIDIPEEFRALGSEVRSELNVHEILEKLKILRD